MTWEGRAESVPGGATAARGPQSARRGLEVQCTRESGHSEGQACRGPREGQGDDESRVSGVFWGERRRHMNARGLVQLWGARSGQARAGVGAGRVEGVSPWST